MGRIDEALRRAGERQVKRALHGDVFTSPWGNGSSGADRRQAGGNANVAVLAPSPIADSYESEEAGVQREAKVKEAVRKPEVSPLSDVDGSQFRVVQASSLAETFKAGWRERLSTGSSADPRLVDQFRRLAAMLLHAQRETGMKSVMITSASPGEGKTLTALNLALILSESYRRRVLLIEGDLRRPVISEAARLARVSGLSEAMRAGVDTKVSLLALSETLSFIPAGHPDPDPLSGLSSTRMQRLLQEASTQFEWVILDTPPLGATADASLLCPLVDATVLVVRAAHTLLPAVQSAIDTLGRERIFGVVLNQVTDAPVTDSDYGYSEVADVRQLQLR